MDEDLVILNDLKNPIYKDHNKIPLNTNDEDTTTVQIINALKVLYFKPFKVVSYLLPELYP